MTLPPDVECDSDGGSAVEVDLDIDELEECVPGATNFPVPTPNQIGSMTGKQAALELYSPARVMPEVRWQPPCVLSLDILTGWDFLLEANRALSLEALNRFDVEMAILSPPCTMFSPLQILFRNFEKMPPAVFQRRYTEAKLFMDHSMEAAHLQIQRRKKFAHEHPQRASSWKLASVESVACQPGVYKTTFDQCMLGLRAPSSGLFFKKRTTIMTNCRWLAEELKQHQCNKQHKHQPIIGKELGKSRSWWAQHYPPGLVALLARSVHEA